MVLVEGKGRKEVVEQPKGERTSKIGNVGGQVKFLVRLL